MAQRVLVTGASGFVGLPLCALLVRAGIDVAAAVRQQNGELAAIAPNGRLHQVAVGDLGAAPDWSEALEGADAVVHLAARVHVMKAADPADDALFRRINVEATVRLATAAAKARVRRIVFVSTAKAHAEAADAYSRSKAEAERVLAEESRRLGLECVILRPPLVYGPRVRANFLRLLRLVDAGAPLPLAKVANRRSLVFVGNLADALRVCIDHPDAAGQTFAVSDGEDISTPELVRRMARALDRRPSLLPFPVGLLRLAGKLVGQEQAIDRLTGDLVVDSSKIRTELDWTPPYDMEQGLAQTAAWYRQRREGIVRRPG